jgi:methyltransferase (TIGR00027 family)
MALFRALESSRPPERRLFEDRFAHLFLRLPFRFVFRLARFPLGGDLIPRLIDSRWPGARSSGVARTRFIDDALRAALGDGVEQVVILGAGFDCRAYRISGIERTRVFEVDHPDTLAEKRRRLRQVLPSAPPHVRLVATDFNHRQLEELMANGGYDPARRTFFIWEGVTNYLTAAAVDVTFRWFATAARGSRVVFTYVHRRVLDDPPAFAGTRRLFRTLRQTGEPWTFGLDPAEVPGYLAGRGLDLLEDLGAVDYRSRYLRGRGREMRGYEFYRIALARTQGRGAEPAAAADRGGIRCLRPVAPRAAAAAERGP